VSHRRSKTGERGQPLDRQLLERHPTTGRDYSIQDSQFAFPRTREYYTRANVNDDFMT
jgi:hypothetical protein